MEIPIGFEKLNMTEYINNDFIHSDDAAVHISDYWINYEEKQIIGRVHFTPKAQSHVGFCHGGSICAVMDDVVGWLGFCSFGQCEAWSGFTAQINVALKKPVPIGSILWLTGEVNRIENGKKVWVDAELVNADGCLYCVGDGLYVRKK